MGESQGTDGGTNFSGFRHDFRFRKLEMPLFDDSNPDGWILKRSIVLWEEMKILLLKQFRSTQAGSLHEQWLALVQEGSVREYRQKFIELSAPLENASDEVALGNFINGLKPDIRVEVRILEPNNLSRAMDLAQKIEEKLVVTKAHKPNGGINPNRAGWMSRTTTSSTEASRQTFGGNSSIVKPYGEVRRLTDSELQKKRDKGLCYRCNDKWAPGHHCKKKELNVLLTHDVDEGEIREVEEFDEVEHEMETAEITQVVEVSLNSVVGLTTPKTMKLKGMIGKQEVVVLIDPGATHNFISLELVKRLQLPIAKTEAYGVTMGTGNVVRGEGICRGVTLQLQGIDIVEEFLPLGLGSSEVILGIQWLETLGMTHTNWKTQVMKFRLGSETITLCGNPSLGKTLVSLKALMRTIKHEGAGILVELNQLEGSGEESPGVPKFLHQTLAEHEAVFDMPSGLPPVHGHEHSIVLKEGSQPISVRPYRYPHIQKDEIERLIKEMLAADESHQQHLAQVLGVLQANGLYANRKKCQFGKTQVAYLGHIISGKGVTADPSKVQAMVSWPTPTNLRALRGFLGLTGYYRKFVAGYAQIALPLTEQLKKDKFGWNSEAETSFEELKRAMTSVLVLAMPDFTQSFIIETDASGFGLGAVLSQGQQPVAFFSQALGPHARLKSIYEKELMAIVFAVMKWRPYLLGRRFIVRTDQQSLKFLLEQQIVGAEYQKWITKLMGYDFDIQYRSGASNRVADALSRMPDQAECTQPHIGFTVEQGVLYYKNRLVLPRSSKLISTLIGEFHTSPIGGHSGETKTYQRIAAELFWVGMRKDGIKFVQECIVCQQNNHLATTPAGLLQPIPLPAQVWDEVTLDFMEGLPRSEGWDTILVVVDRLSKYAHFIGLKHPFTAVSVAGIFVREIVRRHGIPQSVISDRDRVFLSHFWSELFKLQGTTLKRSTAYHPQSDGQTEVVNRCLETYLRCFAFEKPRTWARWLAWAEYWYNTSSHSSTRCTPFRALYGRDSPHLIHYEQGTASVSLVDQLLADRNAILDDLRMHLLRAQQRMKMQADNKRHHEEFNEGDLVFLKLRPYRQRSLAQRKYEKLAARYYGPFKVLQRIGKVAYKLDLPPSTMIHPVFHVSQLRPARGISSSSPVSRLIYTNSGVAILALASNGVHKLWKWQRNNENQAVKEPASGILMTNEMSNINPEDAVPCFALSNNDVYLISASGGKTSLFNMATFKVMDTFNPPPPAVTFIALHPQNNNIIAMGMEDSSIQVFNIKGDEAKINLRGHQKRITGLAFSLVLDVLVSSGADAQLFVWSVAQWKPKAPLPKAKTLMRITNAQALVSLGGTRVQFHKDQRQLLAIREQQITIYKAPKLNFLSEWIPRESSDLITDATYSCDCQLIYASLKDGSVSVLNATTLLLTSRISPTAYLPSNPSLMVYPLVIAAHPSEPNQFALGLTDGAVYILEPLESEGKWGNSFTGGRLPK
ncbi:hypothetical protein HHK36_021419 [Tetracentron sinense]|uniref:Integrase catalytic domain-containing protein n=1 Tax=Tetracentron sinense TaxID=13715 RepID=A0A835D7C4_TETSI|nr:hypothetical protein HHK36_021419 [Tetracentron sinense]